jgi:hypothetical protein
MMKTVHAAEEALTCTIPVPGAPEWAGTILRSES